MSLKSFWNKPVFGDEPATEKGEKKEREASVFVGLCGLP